MDSVINGLNGPNGLIIAFLLILIAICITIGAKHSLIKIHTAKIDIGKESSENERRVLQYQSDWVHLQVLAFEEKIPHNYTNYDKWKARCILEQVYDEIIQWIMQNHIEDTDRYIKLKKEIIWNMVLTSTEHKALRSDNFKEEIEREVELIIRHLILIRAQFSE